MEICKNIINDSMRAYSLAKWQTMQNGFPLCKVPLSFINGRRIGDLSYYEEDRGTRRKVRRIVEKRVCQRLHRQMNNLKGDCVRSRERRLSANQVKLICGINITTFSA